MEKKITCCEWSGANWRNHFLKTCSCQKMMLPKEQCLSVSYGCITCCQILTVNLEKIFMELTPDLVKFCHFGEILKLFFGCLANFFIICKLLNIEQIIYPSVHAERCRVLSSVHTTADYVA